MLLFQRYRRCFTWNSHCSFFSIHSVTWVKVTSLSPRVGRTWRSNLGGTRKLYLKQKSKSERRLGENETRKEGRKEEVKKMLSTISCQLGEVGCWRPEFQRAPGPRRWASEACWTPRQSSSWCTRSPWLSGSTWTSLSCPRTSRSSCLCCHRCAWGRRATKVKRGRELLI